MPAFSSRPHATHPCPVQSSPYDPTSCPTVSDADICQQNAPSTKSADVSLFKEAIEFVSEVSTVDTLITGDLYKAVMSAANTPDPVLVLYLVHESPADAANKIRPTVHTIGRIAARWPRLVASYGQPADGNEAWSVLLGPRVAATEVPHTRVSARKLLVDGQTLTAEFGPLENLALGRMRNLVSRTALLAHGAAADGADAAPASDADDVIDHYLDRKRSKTSGVNPCA